MEWLEFTYPGPGRLGMRRLDSRFHDLSKRLIDYDFNTAGEYYGQELNNLVPDVEDLAQRRRSGDHLVLQANWGQSVIIGADEAAELLPHLQQAVTRAQEAAQRRLSN